MNTVSTQFDKPQVEEAVNNLVAQVQRAEIATKEDFAKAGDLDRWLSQTLKQAEEERRSWTDPLNAQVKRINEQFKPLTDKIKAAREALKGKMLTWSKAEEERRKAEIEAQRKAHEEAAIERASEQEAAGDTEGAEKTLATAGETRAPTSRVGAVHGSFASSSTRSVRDLRVVRIKDLPPWALDAIQSREQAMAQIRLAIKDYALALDKRGEPVPGVEFFDNKQIVTR